MSTDNQLTTNFIDDGVDVGQKYVTKSYLMDVYPYLQNTGISAPGLWLWGRNTDGCLGDETTSHRSSPIQTVARGTTWKNLPTVISRKHIGVVKTDGTLWVWGNDIYGQLGDSTTTSKSSPIQTIAGGTNWKQVSCGTSTMSAIKTDGTLWSWGRGDTGAMGNNALTSRSSPVQTVAGGTNWKQVASGLSSTFAIKTDNSLWVWGQGQYGNLATNNETNYSSPVQTVCGGTDWKQVSAGYLHASAVKTDGTLWSWGYNDYGVLGDNTRTNKSSPVQTIAGGTNWKQVSCGYKFVSAIKTDGTLWSWGLNNVGQVGNNTTSSKSSPVQTIAGGTNWKQTSSGTGGTAAIKTDGTLWVWGSNTYGTLGDNTRTHRSSPIQTITGGNNWKQVTCGYGATFAITEMGDDF